ncbi:MAG: hypothetical protein SH868_19805 [Bythopirellula sp.]|nr:hypothetical protein [Bythopirellula sp.]
MPAKSKKRKQPAVLVPLESKSSEALTVAWTVTITTLLFSNLAIVAAHYFSLQYPDNNGLRLMKEMLLIAGATLGVISLALLPIVYRVRTLAPPTGLAVFGACLAAAPVLALVVRSLR